MKRKFTLMVGAILVAGGIFAPTVAANDGVDAYDLYDHKLSVSLNKQVNMWECWADMDGSDPRLLQKVGKRWITLDTSTVSRDSKKCGKKQPIKAVYTFKVRDTLRWNEEANSYEAVVKTVCSTCITYNWTILVDK